MLRQADGILRSEGIYSSARTDVLWKQTMVTVAVAGWAYGMVMGSFGGPLQALYAALKLPMLVWVSTAVCLPNFFIVCTVLGLQRDFGSAVRGIISSQATFSICLASLAPVVVVGYLSQVDYDEARLLNGAMFAIACIAAQVTLARHFGPLIRKDPRHRRALIAWFGLYIFVGVQLAWVLRPFIGSPSIETRLFRESAWGNAYVEIYEILVRMFGQG